MEPTPIRRAEDLLAVNGNVGALFSMVNAPRGWSGQLPGARRILRGFGLLDAPDLRQMTDNGGRAEFTGSAIVAARAWGSRPRAGPVGACWPWGLREAERGDQAASRGLVIGSTPGRKEAFKTPMRAPAARKDR
jgi:hypothetical protein